ncbi:F-box/kelch-repeat protein At3g06240-like [Lotus japonicus]|uniref:F-box/kelch-repeat protein At3g06240-like n=1 Tax=Lotus japonicus TaxID=34305 RepID=UPI00258BC5F4|nr:F-box/kelch-repeat protein At3g06240-like [Lotus japonicus]
MKIETQVLPQDLITEILLRSPVKSLVRFKAVCKFWRFLISDPHFAILHFELATPKPMFTNFHESIFTMDLDAPLDSDPLSEKIKIDFLPPIYYCTEFLGSCRGFILFECYHRCDNPDRPLYLWNPATRVHKTIPPSPLYGPPSPIYYDFYPRRYSEYSRFYHVFGFGYDSSKDDYLVVKLSIRPLFPNRDFALVQFFSLRANMWENIEFTDSPCLDLSKERRPGLLFNGILHWLVYDKDKSMNVIIAFDLMEKTLFEIPPPDNIALDHSSCNLWGHSSFLSLSLVGSDTIDIFVMKEYKLQSSWTKTHVLSFSGIPCPDQLGPDQLGPLCSTKSGDIVVDYDSGVLVKYNAKGEQLRVWEDRFLRVSRVPMYTESILSLPGVSEQS